VVVLRALNGLPAAPLDARERRVHVLELRQRGLSARSIAQMMSVDGSTVLKDLRHLGSPPIAVRRREPNAARRCFRLDRAADCEAGRRFASTCSWYHASEPRDVAQFIPKRKAATAADNTIRSNVSALSGIYRFAARHLGYQAQTRSPRSTVTSGRRQSPRSRVARSRPTRSTR
jgi:hypothetical protein